MGGRVGRLERSGDMARGLTRLLRRVGVRLALVRVARWWYAAFLVAAILYGVILFGARLFGFESGGMFAPWTLLTIPAVATLTALLGFRFPSQPSCARAIDRAEKSHDLFLTTVLLDPDSPDFSGLVEGGSDKRSRSVSPAHVVPWTGAGKAIHCLAALALLFCATLWLPQLDPFGHGKERELHDARRQQLEQTERTTQLRKAQLAKRTKPGERSEETDLRLDELKKTFVSMEPGKPKANQQALTKQQQELGKSWRRAKQAGASQGMLPQLEQGFGSESPKAEQWRKQLSGGETEALQQELAGLKELAQMLQATPEGAQRRALERELSRRLKELSRFAGDKMASRALTAALERAVAQMKMGSSSELSREALDALAESIDLSQLELSQLQQAMNDLKTLEDALRTLQMAQQCNQLNPLDGSSCTNLTSLADYAAMYAQTIAQCEGGCGSCAGCLDGTGCKGSGAGSGMGGRGQGEGNRAPEDDSLVTDSKSERSKSAMRAGKILMQWESDESADKGRVAEEYDRRISQLREGISEAVVSEGIPPLYHDTIRRYFDSMAVNASDTAPDSTAAPGTTPQPATSSGDSTTGNPE